MRGLLFPYRFSCVVISFVCVCCGWESKKRQGIELREGKNERVEKGSTRMGIKSLHRARICSEKCMVFTSGNCWTESIDEEWKAVNEGQSHEYFQGHSAIYIFNRDCFQIPRM